jgi:hypothetical protein
MSRKWGRTDAFFFKRVKLWCMFVWGGLGGGRHFLKRRCHFLWAYSVIERWILYAYGIVVEWYWHGRGTCHIVQHKSYVYWNGNCLSCGTVRLRMKKEKLVSVAALCWVTGRCFSSKRVHILWHILVFFWWRSCICGTVPCYRPTLFPGWWMNLE